MRISISKVVNSQLPSFVREEYPLFSEFLKQYYISDDSERLIQNLDKNIDLDVLFKFETQTNTTSQVNFIDKTIFVESTYGFPDEYGLIKIDNEIILYETKTETQFLNCARGFSGISEIDNESLVFEETEFDFHNSGSIVYNLSSLFLQIFAMNIKKRISPGFENRDLFVNLNKSNFLKNIKSFYTSKGSDESFRILFGALYGKNVEVIKPRDFLIRASDSKYRFTKDIVVESISGNPYNLLNTTIYQDETETIEPAQGTIVEVNKIVKDNKEYYIISLDFDYNKDSDVSGTLKSNFSVHAKTITTNRILSNSTYIDVDSTIGFPESGQLQINLIDGNTLTVTYLSKVLNQFLDCSGIESEIPEQTEIKTFDYIYGYDQDGSIISMRVNGVLGDVDYLKQTNYYSNGDSIEIETLGQNSNLLKANNWFFNVPVRYEVKKIQLIDSSDFSYRLSVFDDHNFVIGDNFTIYASDGLFYSGNVSFIESKKSIIVKGQGQLNEILTFEIQKNISKVNVEDQKYEYLKNYNSNIQNIYLDYDDSVFVSSPSLPSYYDYPLEIKDFTVKIPAGNYTDLQEIEFNFQHGFYTGDAVVYKSINESNAILDNGVYYVKKIDNFRIKLSRSLYNIQNNLYVTFSGIINSGFESILEPFNFNDVSFNRLDIRPQNLLKKINAPEIINEKEETTPGPVGILINGVEILNFKSNDLVFYGGLRNIDVVSGGTGYNILTPPQIEIIDPVGSGASCFASVEGALERIDILDPGFDYIEQPSITIKGGNGSGATASVDLVDFSHIVEFNSEILVNLVDNTIETYDDHKFRQYEEVIYNTNSQKNIAGLSTNSKYFVEIVDNRKIKLHNSLSNAVSGINTISFTSYGTGIQSLISVTPKKKISEIKVTNPGNGYKNKKVRITGINTASNELVIPNHNYTNGELITYYPENQVISGLNSTTSYYVNVVDKNKIRLSGISTLEQPDINYQRKNYINITSPEFSGNHFLNYTPIEVLIEGKIGVSTQSGQDFSAKIQPIFSGKISDIFLDNKGSSYGSEDILNFEKKPIIKVTNGSGAQLTPIIQAGTITNVIINSSGSGYYQIPKLKVLPFNSTIQLTPIVVNGKIIDIKVINGGSNVNPSTIIDIISTGVDASFNPNIDFRRTNIVEKLIQTKNISKDDGYITRALNSLQYTHLYSPRSLRESILRSDGNTNIKDLTFKFNKEQLSTVHSPLLGWAYDGNPIYGPYGYSDGNSGQIKALKSGYELKSELELLQESRPSLEIYPIGFFVEDYKFTGSGDLDEHNGRYCITPEFPNGTYAYFCTISDIISDSSSPFFNYYSPVFPYIIGNNFRNKLSQNDYSIESLGVKLLRNTTPYNLEKSKSKYNYILNPNKIKKKNLEVKRTKSSKVDSFTIINSGENYKVNDKILFDKGGSARVKSISGSSITGVAVSHTSVYNVEVLPYNNSFIGISSIPHEIDSSQELIFNSKYEINKKIVASPVLNSILLSTKVEPINVTGIITYFNVSSNLNFPLKENDIFTINDEKIKILNIDTELSRIRVERAYDNTTGINTHNVNSVLTNNSRKLLFNIGLSTSYNLKENKEYYFNPQESVGIGTEGNYSLIISNPGTGKSSLTIPTGSIYIKNHNLSSGDSVFYFKNNGSSIEVKNGLGSTTLDTFSELFVTKIETNLIGLSTQKSGDNILYFTGIGTGNNHSFKTNYPNNLIGDLSKNIVTVSTATTHGLKLNDYVNIDVVSGAETTYKVYYNISNRRICINKRYINSVDTINNSITILNHNFTNGEKVIYVSDSPVSGIQSEKIYYVIYVNKDTFRLSETYYNCLLSSPVNVDLTSSGDGYFYSVNPAINVIKNQDIIFDTSDESLSFLYGGTLYPGFELKLFNNKFFKDEYNTYEITKTGLVGIDSTSNYRMNVLNLPDTLYYNFVPINLEISPPEISLVYFDNYSESTGQFRKINSNYSGEHKIVGISSTSFSYLLLEYPEKDSYIDSNSQLKYSTNSLNAKGPIDNLFIFGEKTIDSIPQVTDIISTEGKNAVIKLKSTDVGQIESISKIDIGFGYNKDYTIRPKLNLPKIIDVNPSYKLISVGIQTRGIKYSYAPDLLVFDNVNKEVYSNIKLDYNLTENKIRILENNETLKTSDLKIIATNNDNAFEIDEINYNNITKEVIVKIKTGFSTITEYPFNVGESVFIENVVMVDENSPTYNSKDYGYSSFKIISSTPNIGGVGATFTYSLSEFVNSSTVFGEVDTTYTSGFIVPNSYLPSFIIQVEDNLFVKNEIVTLSNGGSGKVVGLNSKNNQIKILTTSKITPKTSIYGKTSKNSAIVNDVYYSDAFIDIDYGSNAERGWKDNVGFLNDPLQRIHDSNYYQYFSYDLKSEIDYSKWSDTVDSINHTSGFKKFGNLLLNSYHENIGISTEQNLSDFEIVNDFYSEMNVNCFDNFDLSTENYFDLNSTLSSNEIYFNSRRIQNYIKSINNKVLLIDDISDKFKPVEVDNFAIVDSFNKFDYRFKKYILFILDKISPVNSQASILNILHNDQSSFISQYAINQTFSDIGYFDAKLNNSSINLYFYPNIISNKIYTVNSFAYNISDSIAGIGTIDLGDSVKVDSNSTIGIGTTIIASISTSFVSNKLLILYSDLNNNVFHSDEINYIHDGTNIVYNSYGELNTGNNVGIGTYNLQYNGSNIDIEFYPNLNNEYNINLLSTKIFNSSSSTVDSIVLSGNKLESSITNVTNTGIPVKSLIYTQIAVFSGGLHQIVIEDTDNNKVSFYEVFGLLNRSVQELYFLPFGSLHTDNEFGLMEFEYSPSGNLEIYFTPFTAINYQVRVFSTLISNYRRSETLEI